MRPLEFEQPTSAGSSSYLPFAELAGLRSYAFPGSIALLLARIPHVMPQEGELLLPCVQAVLPLREAVALAWVGEIRWLAAVASRRLRFWKRS